MFPLKTMRKGDEIEFYSLNHSTVSYTLFRGKGKRRKAIHCADFGHFLAQYSPQDIGYGCCLMHEVNNLLEQVEHPLRFRLVAIVRDDGTREISDEWGDCGKDMPQEATQDENGEINCFPLFIVVERESTPVTRPGKKKKR